MQGFWGWTQDEGEAVGDEFDVCDDDGVVLTDEIEVVGEESGDHSHRSEGVRHGVVVGGDIVLSSDRTWILGGRCWKRLTTARGFRGWRPVIVGCGGSCRVSGGRICARSGVCVRSGEGGLGAQVVA